MPAGGELVARSTPTHNGHHSSLHETNAAWTVAWSGMGACRPRLRGRRDWHNGQAARQLGR